MAYTVDASFNQFFDNINLAGDHRATANSRKDDIVAKLGNRLAIVEAFSSGSIPKFTALKGHADLDVMVALHYGKHAQNRTPRQFLQLMRDALAQFRPDVRRNGQAVTLKYAAWPAVDVVPVFQSLDQNGNVTHYNVPDANTDSWIKSRPKQHSVAIENKSSPANCGANFRKIIKMIKHWNRRNGDFLQSYHIEVLALKVLNTGLSDLPWHIYKFFDDSRGLLTSSLFYDADIVDTYLTFADRRAVMARFDTARGKARAAWLAGITDDARTAIGTWRQLFGVEFPAYG